MQYQVKNFMYLQNMFVYEDDSLQITEKAMKTNNISKIFVLNSLDEICGNITQNDIDFIKSKQTKPLAAIKAKEAVLSAKKPINVYPQNNIAEVLNTMKQLNLEYLPVCESPNNKKLIGFIKSHIHFSV